MEQNERGKRLVSTPQRKDGLFRSALETARECFVASWLRGFVASWLRGLV